MKPPNPQSTKLFSVVAVSVLLTAAVALALSSVLSVGRGPAFWRQLSFVAQRTGLLFSSLAETGTDSDGDGYTSIPTGGTDCYDSLQSQYSDGTASCDSTATPTFLESKVDGDSDDDIADHAWIKDANGLYHLYYQNEDQGSGDDIEHYTSTDLTSLSYVGLALQKGIGTWDPYGLWAPYVVKSDSTYYMFYTGTTGAGANPTAKQRIGLATSTDLTNWTKYPVNNCSGTSGNGCIYECNHAWTTWDDGGSYDAQCRDPFVIWDAANSRWLMFMTVRLTAATGSTGVSGGISVATSTDLVNWIELGYIKATRRVSAGEGGTLGQLAGTQSENSNITLYNGTYYLFFNDWEDTQDAYTVPNPRTQTQYATSSTLAVDSSGSANWTYRGYIPDPGINASEVENWFGDTWIMTQSIAVSGQNYSGDELTHPRDLRLKRIVWGDNFTFTTSKLTKLACRVASNTIKPGGSEICSDNVDQNCSGTADEALYCAACTDADGDGYGISGLNNCSQLTLDCDDTRSTAKPNGSETCDGIDNDCDSLIDEAGVCTCTEEWGCGVWSACNQGEQTRTCVDVNACGTTAAKPAVTQTCTQPAPTESDPEPEPSPAPVVTCSESWSCNAWGVCSRGYQARKCSDTNSCGTTTSEPTTLKTCTVPAENILISLPPAASSSISIADSSGAAVSTFRPFRNAGAFSVAAGDVDGDDHVDIVAGSAAGSQPLIRIFNRAGKIWKEFRPFSTWVRSGVSVAVGDIDGNNRRDIVVAPGPGTLSRISTFIYDSDTRKFVKQTSFLPVAKWQRGFTMALGDLDGDTRAELIVSPRGASAPLVRVYAYDATSKAWRHQRTFRAYASRSLNFFVTTGDTDGDGVREIITVPGPGASPLVRVFSNEGKRLKEFYAGPKSQRTGIVATAFDRNADGRDEIVVRDVGRRNRYARSYALKQGQTAFRYERRIKLAGDERAVDVQSPR